MTLTVPDRFVPTETAAHAEEAAARVERSYDRKMRFGPWVNDGLFVLLAVVAVRFWLVDGDALPLTVVAMLSPQWAGSRYNLKGMPRHKARAVAKRRFYLDRMDPDRTVRVAATPEMLRGWLRINSVYDSTPANERTRRLERDHAKYWKQMIDVAVAPQYWNHGATSDVRELTSLVAYRYPVAA